MTSTKTTQLENMAALTDKALDLFRQGWTLAQLTNTLTRKGAKLGEDSKTALMVAWAAYQAENTAPDSHLEAAFEDSISGGFEY